MRSRNSKKSSRGSRGQTSKRNGAKALNKSTSKVTKPLPTNASSGFAVLHQLCGSDKGEASLVEVRERDHRLEDEARQRKLFRYFKTD